MRRIHKLVSNGSRKIQSLIGEQKTARKSSRRVMNELFLEMAPLEERVLMATTIMSSSTNPASIIIDVNGSNTTYSTPAEIANALSKLTDQDSITVDSGVNITTNGASISFSAPNITINSNLLNPTTLWTNGGDISFIGTAVWAGGNNKTVVHPDHQGLVSIGSYANICTSSNSGQAGAIDIESINTSIGNNATISAIGSTHTQDGSITISANNVMEGFDINALNQFENIIRWFQNQSATIHVGAGVDIEGGNVSIKTDSGNKLKDQWVSSLITQPLSAIFLETIHKPDLFSLPITVQVWLPQSTIDIENGATISGSGDVSITSNATADAAGKAIWNSIFFQKNGNSTFGAAIGDFYTDANATITLAKMPQSNPVAM